MEGPRVSKRKKCISKERFYEFISTSNKEFILPKGHD
jgi:hypothetical protein